MDTTNFKTDFDQELYNVLCIVGHTTDVFLKRVYLRKLVFLLKNEINNYNFLTLCDDVRIDRELKHSLFLMLHRFFLSRPNTVFFKKHVLFVSRTYRLNVYCVEKGMRFKGTIKSSALNVRFDFELNSYTSVIRKFFQVLN